MIGLMGGAKSEIALGALLTRRLSVVGSTLRTRSSAEKAALVVGLQDRFWTALEEGRLQPIVDRVLPIDQAGAGHRTMKASDHFGKIVLKVD